MGTRSIEKWARASLAQPEGASPWPGPWKPRHPAYREILRVAGTKAWRRLIVCASTQSGKTELLAVLAAYFAIVERSPVLIYTAGMGLRAALSKRLKRFYEAAPLKVLADAYGPARPPHERHMAGGGSIIVLSSTAATAFQSTAARVVLLDEVRSHGSSLILAAEGRQAAWSRKGPLTIALSSAAPRLPCRITELLERSDYRTWRIHAPCCGGVIPVDFSCLDGYGEDPGLAYLECPRCKSRVGSEALTRASKYGWFEPTRTTAQDAGSVGFHVTELSNPSVPLAEVARKYQSAMRAFRNTGQSRELNDFHADALAVTYRDADTTIDPESARINCKAPYDPSKFLPAGVSAITIAADVQIDRLEVEIAGWGAVEVAEDAATKLNLDKRSGWQTWKIGSKFFRLLRFGISYLALAGDPNSDEVWTALDEIRRRPWRVGSAQGPELRAGLCLVDAGGAHTERCRSWCRSAGHSGACVKGSSRPGQPLARPAVTRDILAEYGRPLIFSGTDSAKDIVLGSVRRSALAADGSWCWPEDEAKSGYDWRYFAGLCSSERRMMVESKLTGHATSRYVKSPSTPNEPLDLAVYGLSALAVLGLPVVIQNAARLRLVKGAA